MAEEATEKRPRHRIELYERLGGHPLWPAAPSSAPAKPPAPPPAPPARHQPEPEFFEKARKRQELVRSWQENRNLRATSDKGSGAYALQLFGARLAERQAPAADRLSNLRNAIESSHGISSQKDVEAVARAFVEAIPPADASRKTLSDGARALVDKHREAERQRNEREVAADAEALHDRQGSHWWLRVHRVSEATGFPEAFVDACLRAEEDKRYPGVIDVRLVPFIQVTAPAAPAFELVRAVEVLAPVLEIAMAFTPVVGNVSAAHDAVSGRSVLAGRELAAWERVLSGVAVVLPAIGGLRRVATAGRVAASAAESARAYEAAAPAFVSAARRLGTSSEPLLRGLGRLRRISPEQIVQLRRRLIAAREAGQGLKLAAADAEFLASIERAFADIPSAVRMIQAAPRFKQIVATAGQQAVIRRVLGVTFSKALPAGSAAEEAAGRIRSLLAGAWSRAVTELRGSSDAAARAAFAKIPAAAAADQRFSRLIRKELFDPVRNAAVRRIKQDRALIELLEREAGIGVGREGGAALYVHGLDQQGRIAKIALDFDHAETGLAKAVESARRTGNYRELMSIIDPANLQLLMARENRNVIEVVRAAAELWR